MGKSTLICAAPDCDERLVRSPHQGRNPKWCVSHKRFWERPDNPNLECSAEGCSRPVRAKTVCNMHYKRLLRAEGRMNDQPWNDRRRHNYHARRARMNGARNGNVVMLSEIVARDGSRCQWCGEVVDLELAWPNPLSKSIDHIVPISKGGTHELGNCQMMHLRCNSANGDRLVA